MKILTVVGNRPQFVKAAAVSPHLREAVTEILVHTGQHYDRELSELFFEELDLPRPDHQLGVGSGGHAGQTAATMVGLEPILIAERPDAVLVYGDTNATLGGALVAAKSQVPLAHVEAGMRSFERSMPEEVNRVVVDRLSGLLLCSTETAIDNLGAEGLADGARLVGDVMADVGARFGPIAERRSNILARLGLEQGGYLVATLHRAANVDDPEALRAAADLLVAVGKRHGPLVFPVHPGTRARLVDTGLLDRLEQSPKIFLIEPLGYLDFTCLMRGARVALTDSGGIQKEAYLTGVPCLTLREETEWVETVASGRNTLVGLDLQAALRGVEESLEGRHGKPPDDLAYGSNAGRRCAQELVSWLGGRAAET
jgi:UDP-GlcNAc3NAcA epimerase